MVLRSVLALVGTLVWIGALAVLWRSRRWLVFYFLGALGLVVIVMLIASATGLDRAIEDLEARQVVMLSQLFGQRLSLLGGNGLAIRNHVGWAVFDVGIECSGIMEMAAIAGLIAFYPAVFGPTRKALTVGVGTAMTYVLNLGRILLIAGMVSVLGSDWVFPAHAIFGRIFFVAGTIVLYWRLLTLPTVQHVGIQLDPSRADGHESSPVMHLDLDDLDRDMNADPVGAYRAAVEPEPEQAEDSSAPDVGSAAQREGELDAAGSEPEGGDR